MSILSLQKIICVSCGVEAEAVNVAGGRSKIKHKDDCKQNNVRLLSDFPDLIEPMETPKKRVYRKKKND